LVECFLCAGTGRYEPFSFSPEQSYWHLIKPKQFQPGYSTNEGERIALSVHRKEAKQRAEALAETEASLRQKRRERLKAVSDEALIDVDDYTLMLIAKPK